MKKELKILKEFNLIKEIGMPEGFFLKAIEIKKDHFFGIGCVEDVIIFSKHFRSEKNKIDFPECENVVRHKQQINNFLNNIDKGI